MLLRRTFEQRLPSRPSSLLLCLLVMTTVGGVASYSGKVLLVSMDGFRWDYIYNVTGLGNFTRLATTGCSVEYVDNPFATKTFPCHYSIATGLYEESHGIVANSMYDPVRNATFGKQSKEPFWWDGGEPIWVTAERQNKSTGVYFWPSSEAKIRGYRPSVYMAYNQSVPFPERVRTAVSWLSEGKDFVALYFHEPDYTGHQHGPDSREVSDKVREMDGILGLILKQLEDNHLSDKVNVIITSDHGMTDINVQDKLLDLYDYVNAIMVDRVPDSGTVTAILPVAGREEEVLTAAQRIPHVTAYRKQDIPDHFHYKHNPRIMPIIIISDEGWLLSSKVAEVREYDQLGDHGYSNELMSMKPIFFARGPDFHKNVKTTSISTVDIYPLICRLLNIKASPNNGSLEQTSQFLVGATSSSHTQFVPSSSSRTEFRWLSVVGILAVWVVCVQRA